DEPAGLTPRAVTPAVQRRAPLAGGVGASFARGAERLQERAGVRLAEATVPRTTADAGPRSAQGLVQGIVVGPAKQEDGHRDAGDPTVASFTVDASGTHPPGPGGAAAEGRLAYVAGLYNPRPPDGLLPVG